MNLVFGNFIQAAAIVTMFLFGTFHLAVSFNATAKGQTKNVLASGILGLVLLLAAITLRFL